MIHDSSIIPPQFSSTRVESLPLPVLQFLLFLLLSLPVCFPWRAVALAKVAPL
jgi:hypothetical protein